MRTVITDVLGPVVAATDPKAGSAPSRLGDRLFFEAMLYRARTGIAWRDLPDAFGPWEAVYQRFRRWAYSGRLRAILAALTAEPRFEDVRRVLLDATIVRAHQHAAGSRRKKSTSGGRGPKLDRVWAAAAAGSRPRSS